MSRNKERIERELRKVPGFENATTHWEPIRGKCFEKGGYEGGWTVRDKKGMDFDFLGYSVSEALDMIELKARLQGKG